LDKDSQEQKRFSPADVEAEGHSLEVNVDQQMVRLGLYCAEELTVLSPLQKDEKQVFPVSFGVTEHIYEVMKDRSPWDLLVKRGRANVENYPYGRSLDRIDIPDQPKDRGDLPDKEKLFADVSSFLTRKAGIALLVIDLDHFKNVNDTKGHQEGDACLDRVVKVGGGVLGRKGILYRWGGDEFAIALPDFSTEEAHATGERIRRAIEHAKPGTDLPVTTSIGVSGNDRITDGSAEVLLDAADKAMYKSKEKRNRVTSWSAPEFLEKAIAPVTRIVEDRDSSESESRGRVHFVPDAHNNGWAIQSDGQMEVRLGGMFTYDGPGALTVLKAFLEDTQPLTDMMVQVITGGGFGKTVSVPHLSLDSRTPVKAFINLRLTPVRGTKGELLNSRILFRDAYNQDYAFEVSLPYIGQR
jgi:diguanylate cyclase (GGDEF)-like protein